MTGKRLIPGVLINVFPEELTDAIAEDWGGKPFVDLRAGWKHILDNYPEVRRVLRLLNVTRLIRCRLTQIGQWQPALAGEATLSSESLAVQIRHLLILRSQLDPGPS